ncbi:MAG: type II toxin-antitoxin system HicA family toxin [Patescibacteria group bacterium]
MPKGLVNWTFNDVVGVLKEHGFQLNYVNSSHYYYTGHYGKILRQVCVPFHGKKTLKPRTLKGIIIQSGIPKERWLEQ